MKQADESRLTVVGQRLVQPWKLLLLIEQMPAMRAAGVETASSGAHITHWVSLRQKVPARRQWAAICHVRVALCALRHYALLRRTVGFVPAPTDFVTATERNPDALMFFAVGQVDVT